MTKTTRITRLFIANRGEIARRIALTARRLGIETVCVTDREVPPAYLHGIISSYVKVELESPALYLDGAQMVGLARGAGCDAVHPGFGFLSENAQFAAAVEAAGLIWVGPNPKSINAMASKATARGHAESAKVPCVRGISGFPVPASEDGDFTALEAFAKSTGYPLLLKAALGGGGKGMRLVHNVGELRVNALRAASEARNAFGDDALVCEQYLGAPRHVEVQVLADKHGHAYAIGDRDCSLQRRHQKIIEEAPAPELTEATRQALHEAATRLAARVGYDSTGTVEFLVDWTPASRNAPLQRFYFLEMNTRLQVEHPVTEEVYGLDLVEWQLRVAQGEPLPTAFASLAPRGHSVEVRIYAEDVRRQFFPAPGPVACFRPALGPGLRWEVGLDEVDEVTGKFDPMVAKLIATAATRPAALARLADALERTVFAGPANNIELLSELALRSPFATAAVTTHFLTEHGEQILKQLDARRQPHAAAGELLLSQATTGQFGSGAAAAARGASPEALTQQIFTTRRGAAPPPLARAGSPAVLIANESSTRATLGDPASGAHRAGMTVQVGQGLVLLGGNARPEAFWYAAMSRGSEQHSWVSIGGCVFDKRTAKAAGARTARQSEGASSQILAPVPGKVVTVKVSSGTLLEDGQTVLVLESMKMEFEVKADRAGKLAEVCVKSGEQVAAGQVLARWSE